LHFLTGVTVTETWTTANLVNTKLELEDTIAAGLKAEFLSAFSTKQGPKGQKLSLYFKQGAFNSRAFFDYNPNSGNINATVDGVVAHEGFVVGGEAGYDVQKAALTRYSAALGYSTPLYSGAITATNNLSVFAASYYHKVNPSVEAGVKAAYDTKSSSTVGLEIASKYKIDPATFAKV
jgi:voltage-dependent anion channel protein 2